MDRAATIDAINNCAACKSSSRKICFDQPLLRERARRAAARAARHAARAAARAKIDEMLAAWM